MGLSNALRKRFDPLHGEKQKSAEKAGEEDPDSEEKEEDNGDAGQPGTLNVLLGTVGVPAVALVLYAIARHSLSIGAVAAMVASGVFALGSLLGFLFGIPRVLASQAEQPVVSGGPAFRHLPNSNLEQVSDWLTKILIGVGLVELNSLVRSVGHFAETLEPALGGDQVAQVFAIGLVVAFFVSGFLAGYLFTRLRLQAALVRADAGTLEDTLERKVVDATLVRVEKQGKADADADREVTRQLDPREKAEPSLHDLKEAVVAASPGMKKQIFDKARRQRQQGWRGRNSRLIERTEPVFRALIDDDKEERFHRHFAQLGYALKDSSKHDFRGAEEALSKAIEIRDRNGDTGYRIYDLNRALCRIALDKQDPPQPSDPETRELILSDLRAAASERYSKAIISRDSEIQDWLKRNNATIEETDEPD